MIMFLSPFLNKFFFLFVSLLGLGFLIAVHELGHFLFCKLFNVFTPSFSIGFGPIIISKKIGETEFKLSAIPLGGYVEIAQAEEQSIPEGSNALYFETIHWYKKFLIMLGGISFNLLSAYFIFITLAIMQEQSILYKEYASSMIESVAQKSLASDKGLSSSFLLTKINNTPINKTNSLREQFEQVFFLELSQTLVFADEAGHLIEFKVDIPDLENLSSEKKAALMLEKLSELGVIFKVQNQATILSAICLGIKQTNKFIRGTFLGLKAALTRSSTASLSGPIMIIAMSSKMIEKGLNQFLIFLALISINLAIINLLPLPILDGGQFLFLAIELMLRRPLNSKIREYISIVCWVVFMALFAYLSCKDILKLIK